MREVLEVVDLKTCVYPRVQVGMRWTSTCCSSVLHICTLREANVWACSVALKEPAPTLSRIPYSYA